MKNIKIRKDLICEFPSLTNLWNINSLSKSSLLTVLLALLSKFYAYIFWQSKEITIKKYFLMFHFLNFIVLLYIHIQAMWV